MTRRIFIFLGPTWSRVLIAWLAMTGLVSLVLNAFIDGNDWVRPVQSIIAYLFLVGVIFIVVIRMPPGERGRWSAILIPIIIAVLFSALVAPPWNLVLLGGAVGWLFASILITRNRMPIEYREAVNYLRKNEYDRAASVMDEVISADPKHLQHYKFRAEIFRLSGKLKLAIRDYQQITELDPKSAIGFNGLAEVYLQAKDFRRAHDAALQANNLSSNDWVTLYNLGLIEDRLKDSVAAIAHLKQALALNVSDSRHRLLINLYLLRAYGRLERQDEAEDALKALRRDIVGLEEWQTILASNQAITLREVIGDDVQTAIELVNGDLSVTDMRYA